VVNKRLIFVCFLLLKAKNNVSKQVYFKQKSETNINVGSPFI